MLQNIPITLHSIFSGTVCRRRNERGQNREYVLFRVLEYLTIYKKGILFLCCQASEAILLNNEDILPALQWHFYAFP
jgi:hypothetical protein